MGCWLTAPVLWLGWAVLVLSFGLYAVFEFLCGGFYKYQNLRQRYKAEWALVTGASSGECTRVCQAKVIGGSDHSHPPAACSSQAPQNLHQRSWLLLQALARRWPSVWPTRA